MSRSAGVLTFFVLLLAAGCGSEKKAEEGGTEKECDSAPAAMAGQPTLPAKFPTPDNVTYTGQKKTGPSSVVSGYRDGELGDAFDEYKSAFDWPATRSQATRRKRTTPRSTTPAVTRLGR